MWKCLNLNDRVKSTIFIIFVCCLSVLLSGCSVNKNLYLVGPKIWYQSISPDYGNGISHTYRLEQKMSDLPFDRVTFICEKEYAGIELDDGRFDTLDHCKHSYERYLNEEGYVYLDRTFLGDGTLLHDDTLYYEFDSYKSLKTVTKQSRIKPSVGYIWHIEYNKNRLIKRCVLNKINGRLIAEKVFRYHPRLNEVVATTRYGKRNILTKTNYQFDKEGKIVSERSHRYLNETIGYTSYEYDATEDFTERFQWFDSSMVLISEGYSTYRANHPVENFYNQIRSNAVNKHLELFDYDTDGKLKQAIYKSASVSKNQPEEVPDWDEAITTKYVYKTDDNHKNVWEIKKQLETGTISITISTYR